MKDPKIIIDSDVAQISARYAEQYNTSATEAMRLFLGSKTYEALVNVETGLCFEMTSAIYELFLDEVGENDDGKNN